MTDCTVRNERPEERREVENIVRESFLEHLSPGCLEHFVLNQLRNDPAFVPELNLVLEKDGKIVVKSIFMFAKIQTDSSERAFPS